MWIKRYINTVYNNKKNNNNRQTFGLDSIHIGTFNLEHGN